MCISYVGRALALGIGRGPALAIAAGACATVALLKPVDDALTFLDTQGVRYLAIDGAGGRYAK